MFSSFNHELSGKIPIFKPFLNWRNGFYIAFAVEKFLQGTVNDKTQ